MDTGLVDQDNEGNREGDSTQAEAVEKLSREITTEEQRIEWVQTLTPLVDLRTHDDDTSPQVRIEFDLMQIAACSAMRRLLRGPMPGELIEDED